MSNARTVVRRSATGLLTLGALAASAALLTPTARAGSSALDPSFDGDGMVVIDDGVNEQASDVAVQPDGRIVAVGNTYGSDLDGMVVRLNTDGSRDSSFGYRRLDGPGPSLETADAVAIQPDGKIVVAGSTSTNYDGAVWRLLPSGALDPTFGGGDGYVTIDSSSAERLNDVALAPDGRIVLAGHTSGGGGDATVYRLTPDGEMDPTFDGEGALGLGGIHYDHAHAVAVQPDGKIVVTGYFDDEPVLTVYRLNVNGSPDLGFGGGGGAARVSGVGNWAGSLVVQPDGGIIVGSYADVVADEDAVVVRLTPDGAVDPRFGGPAGVRIDLGSNEWVVDLAPLRDGRVAVLGRTEAGEDNFLAVLGPDGTLDPSFGRRGTTLVTGMARAYAVAAQRDGKLVVAGDDDRTNMNALVFRYLGDYAPAAPAAVPTCKGKRATIVGTPGKDRLRGTRRADVIVALGGNDVVNGLGGNDVICGGDGNDRLIGGGGKDVLIGEKGNDTLVGGAGKDRLVGGPGRDSERQ